MLNSYFLVNKINPRTRMISIIDLLNLEEEHAFMDLSLSQFDQLKGGLLFTRLLPFSKINMLAGASMPFPARFHRRYRKLYNSIGKKLKTKDLETKRFQIFWQLYQRYGIPMKNRSFE